MMKRRVTKVVVLVMSVCMLVAATTTVVLAYNEMNATGNPKGHFRSIWGFDEKEFTDGMKLGRKDSDAKKYVVDAGIGDHGYDMVVKNDGKGQSGKYAEITVHGKPNDFNYTNPIFDLTKYPGKEKVNDFNGYDEMWCWVDITGFGKQESKNETTGEVEKGFDFSFQLYEQDWKDGKKVPGKFERWAIVEGGDYYVQENGNWKKLQTKKALILNLPQNYKGWIRLPFKSMDVVAILGLGNMKLDLNYVVNFTLGIPMDESTHGKSMKLDSIGLYSTKDMPSNPPPVGNDEQDTKPDDGGQPNNPGNNPDGVSQTDGTTLTGDSSMTDEQNTNISGTVSGSENTLSEDSAGGVVAENQVKKSNLPIVIGISVVAIILIAAAVTAFLILKKRRAEGETELDMPNDSSNPESTDENDDKNDQ